MSKRFRSPVAAALTVVAITLVVSGEAGSAQTPPPPPTTTTTNALDGLVRSILAPTTTAPGAATPAPGGASAPAPGATPKPGAGAPPAPTTTTSTTTPPGVIPPEFIPIINSVRRTPGRSTAPLIDALRPMLQLGMTPQEVAVAGFGHFPVAGPADYSDDFLEPRFGPPFHLHQGTDIFAARGTPVRAPFPGVVRFEDGGLGGKAAYVTEANGTFYYMAHLDSYSPKFRNGSPVKQGDVVGFVGDTGNAQGGATHLHFEVHPGGGAAVDPKPLLDGWINEAINNAGNLLGPNNAGVSRAVSGAGALRQFDGQTPTDSGRAEGPLLWASSVSAGGGTIRLAQLQVARMAGRIDWGSMTTAAQAQADALRQGRDMARSILVPLTPPVLGPLLSNKS